MIYNFKDVNDYLEWKFWIGLWSGLIMFIGYLIFYAMKAYHDYKEQKRKASINPFIPTAYAETWKKYEALYE